MSIKGSSYVNFRRALATRDLMLVRAAAAELPQVPLDDALEVCLLLRGAEPASYERATVRWLGRFCLECRGATIKQVTQAAAAFERLPADPPGAVGVLKWLVREAR